MQLAEKKNATCKKEKYVYGHPYFTSPPLLLVVFALLLVLPAMWSLAFLVCTGLVELLGCLGGLVFAVLLLVGYEGARSLGSYRAISILLVENRFLLHVTHWQHLRHVSFFLTWDLSLTGSICLFSFPVALRHFSFFWTFCLFSFPAALGGPRPAKICVVNLMVFMMIGILLQYCENSCVVWLNAIKSMYLFEVPLMILPASDLTIRLDLAKLRWSCTSHK